LQRPVIKTALDLGDPAGFFKFCIFSAIGTVICRLIYRTMRQNPDKSSMSWNPLANVLTRLDLKESLNEKFCAGVVGMLNIDRRFSKRR
jgi:hypothetical protein